MRGHKGFTVIEVTIFLALTGMLFLIALLGTGAFVGQTRFSDGMRRLESHLQSQYDEVISGVNPRDSSVTCTMSAVVPGSSNPGTSSCVLLGKLMMFPAGTDTVESYYVVGTQPSVIDPDLPVTDLILSFSPRAATSTNVSEFQSPWGIEFVQAKRASSVGPINAIAVLRSPVSSQVVTYVFNQPSAAAPLNASTLSTQASNTTANFCFRSADNASQVAAIQLANGQGSTTLSVLFDTTVAASC